MLCVGNRLQIIRKRLQTIQNRSGAPGEALGGLGSDIPVSQTRFRTCLASPTHLLGGVIGGGQMGGRHLWS